MSNVKFTAFYNDPPVQGENLLMFEEQDPTSSGKLSYFGELQLGNRTQN